VVANFIRAIKNFKMSPEVYGSGLQSRDFVHVDDVCNVIYKISENLDDHFPESLDVGTGHCTSIIELAKHMVNYYGINGEIILNTDKNSGTNSSVADIEKLKKYLPPAFELKYPNIIETNGFDDYL
jgi:UDP-glucose 4-epimerase